MERPIPGTRAAGSPPVIHLDRPAPADDPDGHGAFDGALDRNVVSAARGEQVELRRRLFGTRPEAPCALCGEVYPVGLLVAAHIKKRAACTDQERRDLGNIAMAACLFGCDALYEQGYLTVDATGHIITATKPHADGVRQRLERLAGRRVPTHRSATAHYFAWHHDNAFKTVPHRHRDLRPA
ncbi:hypothetical protein GCM10009827_097470 [Dactylosporangium maewongense]|uniref:HNH endonuclease n=1 Tax=Dactylosporangium maewongense TaxID=634393 RepID=A0ABN2CLD8_9ACTN